MVSRAITSNDIKLDHLFHGIELLFNTSEIDLLHSSENENQFSVGFIPSKASSLIGLSSSFAPFVDIFRILMDFQIQNGSASAIVDKKGGLIVNEIWSEDSDLTPEDIPLAAGSLLDEITNLLEIKRGELKTKYFTSLLERLAVQGGEVNISIQIQLDKNRILRGLEWPRGVKCLLYISSEKLLNSIINSDFEKLNDLFTPNFEHTIIILLGDVRGSAIGQNIKLLGRDSWKAVNPRNLQVKEFFRNKIISANSFWDQECQVNLRFSGLTPFHLRIEDDNLDNKDIAVLFSQLRDRLCLIYLANRTRYREKNAICEFWGYKHAEVSIPPIKLIKSRSEVYKLFVWAYENSSSDKIGILRQIITLQLTDESVRNFQLLLERSGQILDSAKSNFQIYLKRSVELYFDKRMRISEFLKSFNEDISENISKLTSEAVNNFYRTIGIVLGVFVATLVEPRQSTSLIFWSSLLYLIYIVVIILFLLPFIYSRYTGIVKSYEHNKKELKDILSSEEIGRLEGKLFTRTKREFTIAFILTNLGYALVGTVALLILWAFKPV